jgi:hypothetical protein
VSVKAKESHTSLPKEKNPGRVGVTDKVHRTKYPERPLHYLAATWLRQTAWNLTTPLFWELARQSYGVQLLLRPTRRTFRSWPQPYLPGPNSIGVSSRTFQRKGTHDICFLGGKMENSMYLLLVTCYLLPRIRSQTSDLRLLTFTGSRYKACRLPFDSYLFSRPLVLVSKGEGPSGIGEEGTAHGMTISPGHFK